MGSSIFGQIGTEKTSTEFQQIGTLTNWSSVSAGASHIISISKSYMDSSQELDECRVVLGKNRHWRTNKYSTFTFMCNPEKVRKFCSRF
jgi:hypothetical protein